METSHFNIGHRSRLKERFLKSDTKAFKDYEILELVLFNALPRIDTKPIAKALLRKYGSLLAVLNAEPQELKKIKNIGDSTILQFKIIKDLLSRIFIPIDKESNIISNWNAVINYCKLDLSFQKIEYFRVLFLNRKNQLMSDDLKHSGTIDHVDIYPREIAKKALELGASSVILVHNHPSGDPSPSDKDVEITKNIIKTLHSLDIKVLDHIIIAGHKHFSFKESGLIK